MQALIEALEWALSQIDDDLDPDQQAALAAARATLADARGLLPVDEVTADPATGDWLTAPLFTGRYERASDWHLRTDTFVALFDTYQAPDGTTRAIIVRWSA